MIVRTSCLVALVAALLAMLGCHHDDKVAAVAHHDDDLLPCPTHSWTTPPPLTKVELFGDACPGLDQAACTAKCEAGDRVACTEAGTWLGSAKTNYREQLRLYTRACELGDLLGCTNLGTTVHIDSPEWKPQKPNFACAADLYDVTCAAGEPNGCGELAFAYLDGEGRPRDVAKAVAAFKRGCLDTRLDDIVIARGVATACGLFLENVEAGKLGTVDPAVVKAAEAKTCDLGDCFHK